MENNIIISINFGANNSKVGIFKDGKVQLVPNSVGDILTPSIVEILNKSEKVGEEIIRYNINESNLISNLNQLFDKLISDLDDLDDYEEKDYSICIKKNGKDIFYKPEEIISFIFKKLIKNASDFMGETITKAILTVPFYFNELQIALMMKCAVISNIKVVKFLKEPIAAAMAYGFGIENISKEPQFSIMKKDDTSDKLLFVFDFGGAKLDMSILRANDLVFIQVVNNLVDTNFGGNDFDNKLIDLCIKDFCTKININENEIRKDFNALRRLKIHCKKAKEKLSKYNSTNITIYHFFKEFDLNFEINIEKFNEECKDLFNKIEKKLDKILLDSNFSNDNIDNVILVGGSTKIKKVQELLEKKFSKNKIMNKLNYDEVIAIGATLEARNIMIKKKDVLKIVPYNIYVDVENENENEKIKNDEITLLIKKDSKIPISSKEVSFKTTKNNQKLYKIKIYYGEGKYIKDNILIAEFVIDNLPSKKAGKLKLLLSIEIKYEKYNLYVFIDIKSIHIQKIEVFSIEVKKIKKKPNELNKQKLLSISEEIDFLKDTNIFIKNNEKDIDKMEYLKKLSNSCSKIIDIYEQFKEDDNIKNIIKNIYENIFEYSKLYIYYYSQMIILEKEDKNKINLINKIKEIIAKFINNNDNIENLIDALYDLKFSNLDIFYEIILFSIENLYKLGNKFLEEKKNYSRYYAKTLYNKVEKMKSYINEEPGIKMNKELVLKYDEIEKNYSTKKEEIDSFAFIIEDKIKQNNIINYYNTGFELIDNIISQDLTNIDEENIKLIVDIYQEMVDSLSKGPISVLEVFCLIKIIEINFKIFKNNKFQLYDTLNERINYILKNLEENYDIKDEWFKHLIEINEEIKNKKKELI